MPGHKRNGGNFDYLKHFSDIDITEIDGFDNLHSASGILKSSMEKAAALRGADRAFYLVNGSTCGILAVICAALKKDDKVIVARNCHKSVYNGIELAGAKPVFVYPEINGKYGICSSVKPCKVEQKLLENPDAKLVIITSPTYEGVISDIKKICEIAHKKNIPVMVDGAHGAHLGFGNFPQDAIKCGADASVESLHKTLPSLTQTAVCYLSGKLIDENKVAEKLSVFETSSPSYILLSSIDGCINALKARETEIFDSWEKGIDGFFEETKKLKNIEILDKENDAFFDLDKSKIVLFPKNRDGIGLAEGLRQKGIEPEMIAPCYVVCMTGAGDTPKNFKKLKNALKKLDKGGFAASPKNANKSEERYKQELNGEFCEIKEAAGRVSAGYVWAYPPEVPILVPNEEISEEAVKKICDYKKSGLEICGDIEGGKILVVK